MDTQLWNQLLDMENHGISCEINFKTIIVER